MVSPLKLLVKHVTYPFWMRREGHTAALRNIRYYTSGRWCCSREMLERSQLDGLRKLLVHAARHTAYYRDLFGRLGFDPTTVDHPYQIRALPLLTKSLIRENLDEMLATHIPRDQMRQTSTGGSTGVPLVFFRDPTCCDRRKGQEVFFDRWMGYDIGDKVALFVARAHAPSGKPGWKARVRNATGARLLAFDPYDTSEAYMETFYRRYREFRPKFVKCFPNSLYVFARFMKQRGYDPGCITAVSCTGETLYDYQRQLFEELFRCPVFEKYGTFEHGVISCECTEHRGQHIFTDGVVLEVLRDGEPAKPGEIGDIVVTDLFNYGMPFIRYRIGDKGILSDRQCPCGSKLPMIERLLGRDRDLLVAGNGELKPGYLFVEVFNKNHIPGQFQVLQRQRDRVEIRMVRHPEYTDAHQRTILEKFTWLLGSGVEIRLEEVEVIPREASGKYAYVKGECVG